MKMKNKIKKILLSTATFVSIMSVSHISYAFTVACSDDIKSVLDDDAKFQVESDIGLASNAFTMPESLTDISCLNDILNSGLGILFGPPDLSGILDMLKNQACNYIDTAYSDAVNPIMNRLNEATSISGGELGGTGIFIPGGNIGIGINQGQANGGSRIETNADRLNNAQDYLPEIPGFSNETGNVGYGTNGDNNGLINSLKSLRNDNSFIIN